MEFRRVLFRSLLDRLEQRIAGLLGEPVGILHDQDLPAPAHRGERGAAYQISDLVDTDREFLGADQRQDRKCVVWGKSVAVRVDLGGRRIIEKKNAYHIKLITIHNISQLI